MTMDSSESRAISTVSWNPVPVAWSPNSCLSSRRRSALVPCCYAAGAASWLVSCAMANPRDEGQDGVAIGVFGNSGVAVVELTWAA